MVVEQSPLSTRTIIARSIAPGATTPQRSRLILLDFRHKSMPGGKIQRACRLSVLRESERPKTFHRLCDLRDQNENKNAAVAAAKVLEQISDAEVAKPSNAVSPGVTIVIRHARADDVPIDVTPKPQIVDAE